MLFLLQLTPISLIGTGITELPKCGILRVTLSGDMLLWKFLAVYFGYVYCWETQRQNVPYPHGWKMVCSILDTPKWDKALEVETN